MTSSMPQAALFGMAVAVAVMLLIVTLRFVRSRRNAATRTSPPEEPLSGLTSGTKAAGAGAAKGSTKKRRDAGFGSRLSLGLLSLVILLGSLGAALYIPPNLGLDLSGGTQMVLETSDSDTGAEANAENTDNTIEVLRQRVDTLGVSEATLSRSGENRIIVELPGVQDPAEAAEIIGTTAQLTFHPVLGVGEQAAPGMPGGDTPLPDPGTANAGDEDEAAEDEADEALPPATDEEDAEAPEEMDPEELEDLMGDEGMEGMPEEAPEADPAEIAMELPDEQGQMLQLGEAELEGEEISSAEAGMDEFQANWIVNVNFRGTGSDAWTELTGDAACFNPGDPRRRVAIVLDDQIISAPQVNEEFQCDEGMPGNAMSITGDFTQESAEDLAVLIEGGALPLNVEEIERRTVGPTLGEEAIEASWKAALIGLILTALYITVAYRMVGFLASVALGAYTLIAYAALVVLGATLTLPGLAGFVLAIGMAIDANVLIFERAREEYQRQRQVYEANKSAGMADATPEEVAADERTGGQNSIGGATAGESSTDNGGTQRQRRRAIPPNLHKAFLTGTQRAWSAVLDTNVTTMIAAILLILLASGPVQGFGWTLSIGTIASMISALIIARVLVEWAVRRSVVRAKPGVTGLSRYSRVREWLLERNPNILGRSQLWLGIAALVLLTAIGGMLLRGLNLGVEFEGGRVLDLQVSEEMTVQEARSLISDAGYPQAVVQESGDGDLAIRTAEATDEDAAAIQAALETEGEEVTLVSDEMIGPSLGDQLRNQALIALGAALALQMIYLAWRFRWSFGVATMSALAFNITLVIGLFAWLGKPIDGVFLAAILSVIGFSVNDYVVVFDRVRDEWSRDEKSPFKRIANTAILHTLPRTVNTTIGAVFILATLALFGGASLTDFALAMLVGLITGVLSTIFVATPLAIWLNNYDRTPPPHVIKERKAKQRKEMERARAEDDGAVV
ncbi:protein translocase subunit SecD [Lipingzhangella sp. LS1_29]|uniref:Multifunctional fusion protein n=1 Tax=Lipingzhangella rawalii TaxID=2055835 RepID=A0ABU2H6W5_9ACTN|nr:protein translocase subunit SecD [Lipingzhangella rawalii]MDS1270364.1 protein translocase subunit SecD [Lipingzhangella rawalii]